MDRGGTITWYLTANDAAFNATARKVREEAKKTGNDVDRDFKKGFGGAKLSLDDFHSSMARSAAAFRNFQIALRGFELTSLVIGATIAGGAIIELVGAISALAGLLVSVPAGVATFAGALGAISVATSGVADSFKELTKKTAGVSAAQSLAKKQSDLMQAAQKRDESLTRRLVDLKEQYGDVLQELANERMRKLNEQILKGVEAWDKITDSALGYLDVSENLKDMADAVTDAQTDLNQAITAYGAGSQQALEAGRNLYTAQARLANSNAELDASYNSIKDNVKDLATNINSLQKANRNEIKATTASLHALRLDKEARGEATDEINKMIDVVERLANIKDTKLGLNPDLGSAQSDLDALKQQFPDIAVAAQEASTSTEESLTKSLKNIADSMEDVRRERADLQKELTQNLAEATQASAAGAKDPFEGLSKNARSFVSALKEVYEAFQPIKNTIQDRFFDGLDKEIRSVAKVAFPILEDGLGNIAGAMNGLIKEASRVVQQPFFTGAVSNSLNNTAAATTILQGALEPLARVFTDLVNIGNPYILMLSEWIVKQSELAAAFTGSEQGQRKLNEALQLGITALQQIGKFFGSVAGLAYDLFKISNEAGFSLIGTLTEMTNKIRDYIATEEGQARMKALFEATDTILRQLLTVLGSVVDGILGIVEAYNNLDGPAKAFVTNLLVFSAVATPILTYVSSLFASLKLVMLGVQEAFQALDYVVGGKLSKSFGGLGKIFTVLGKHPLLLALGAVIAVFTYLGTQTDVFQNALKSIQPALDEFGVAMQPVLDALGEMGRELGQSLAPVIPVVAEAFGQILTALLPLVPIFLQIIQAIMPVFVDLLKVAVTIIKVLAVVIGGLAEIIAGVLTVVINVLVGVLKLLVDAAVGTGKAFADTWNGIVAIWNGAPGFFRGIWNGIVAIFVGVGQFFFSAFNTAVNYIRSAFGGVGRFFQDIWNNIMNAFNGAFNLGKNIVEGLWNGITSMTNWILNKIRGFGDSVLKGIKDFFGIRSPSRIMRDEVGKMLGLGIAGGITESTSAAVNAAKSASEQIMAGFTTGKFGTEFSVDANMMSSSQMAPAVSDNRSGGISAGANVNIVQNNDVHTDLDMEQVNRNLAWELLTI